MPVRFRTKSGKIVPLLIDSNVAYKVDEKGEKAFNHTRCFIRDDTGRRVREVDLPLTLTITLPLTLTLTPSANPNPNANRDDTGRRVCAGAHGGGAGGPYFCPCPYPCPYPCSYPCPSLSLALSLTLTRRARNHSSRKPGPKP